MSELPQPTISAAENLPEITVKATIIAIILTILLAAANAYLGLKVGITISASIPAAVISMGILRFFKNSNILENNIVQTAASSGEALASGIIFTLPALIILHMTNQFSYWPSVMIGILGGTLGVLFSIPLRRILLAQPQLRFPEGTAIAHVLQAGNDAKSGLNELIAGGTLGSVIAFAQSGLKVLAGAMNKWYLVGGTLVGSGLGFSPALLAAGYIIGIEVAVSILIGILLGWIIGIPIIFHYHSTIVASPADIVFHLWDKHVRYMGIGAMMGGGIAAIISLAKPIYNGIKASLAIKSPERSAAKTVLRTDKDTPGKVLILGSILISIALFLLASHFTTQIFPHATFGTRLFFTVFALAWSLIGGFFLASTCGYFAGLVGSSASPLSSMILCMVIIGALLLLGLTKVFYPELASSANLKSLTIYTILISAITAAASGIANDSMQDLKTGQLVGATPWKQQAMLILGVIVSSLVIPQILQLLFNAYGIAGVFPRPGMDPNEMLQAPQASLIATVTVAIFHEHMRWTMILIGIGLSVVASIINFVLHKRGKPGLSILAIGIGIYLPMGTSTPLFLGGLAAYLINKKINKSLALEQQHNMRQKGLLIACGMVAGAALIGVLLAIPFVVFSSTDILRMVPQHFASVTEPLSIVATLVIYLWVKRHITKLR